MPCFSVVSNLKLRNFLGRFSEKSIHNSTDNDTLSNHWRSTCKISRGNTFVRRVLKSIWFHTQKKEGVNTSSIWSPQRNCYCYNDALQGHVNHSPHIWQRHWLLRHCHWGLARRHISTISIRNLFLLTGPKYCDTEGSNIWAAREIVLKN